MATLRSLLAFSGLLVILGPQVLFELLVLAAIFFVALVVFGVSILPGTLVYLGVFVAHVANRFVHSKQSKLYLRTSHLPPPKDALFNFLGLPPELRDEIITFVILSPPVFPDTVKRKVLDDDYGESIRLYHLEPGSHYQPTALNLLLVNHQIHDETCSALRRKRPNFKLNLAFTDSRDTLSTWHFIPTQRHTCLDALEIDVIFCHATARTSKTFLEEKDLMIAFLSRLNISILRFLKHREAPVEDFFDNMIPEEYTCGLPPPFPVHAKRLQLNIVTQPGDQNGQIPHSMVPDGALVRKPVYMCFCEKHIGAGRAMIEPLCDLPPLHLPALKSLRACNPQAVQAFANRLVSEHLRPEREWYLFHHVLATRFGIMTVSVDGVPVHVVDWEPWIARQCPDDDEETDQELATEITSERARLGINLRPSGTAGMSKDDS